MDLPVTKLGKQTTLALGGLLALTMCAGSLSANTSLLSASATASSALTATITCNTQYGPSTTASGTTAVTLAVHAFPAPTGVNTITIGVVANSAVKMTPNTTSVLTAANNAAGLVFTVAAQPGCANTVSNANSLTVQLTAAVNAAAAGNDVTVAVSDTVTATNSALVAQPVTINCGYSASGPVYVPGAPQTVAVTSAAVGGTPFTADTTVTYDPAYVILTPVAPGGTATATASVFQIQAATLCGSGAGTDKNFNLHLVNSPAPVVSVAVTLHYTTVSPLTVTPVPSAPTLALTYTKTSGNAAIGNVSVTSTLANAYFTVNTATLPIWLTVNITAATVPTNGKTMQFSTTTQVDSLPPGNYSATVFLQLAGYADTPIPITLLVTNATPKLVITSANPMPVTYIIGGTTPVTTITVASTDSPIPYSISLAGALAPTLAVGEQATGIAYSFGSNVAINYNPLLFSTSPPGTVLSGTVTFTWGSPASVTVVTLNLTVTSPGATITSISPGTLPTAAPGTVFHVSIIGSGFVGGSNPALATRVGFVTGSNPGSLNTDTNFRLTYNSPANLDLQITVPATADPNLLFSPTGAGGPVYLGVANGTGSIPTGTATLMVAPGPIIYGITSSSSFTEVSGGNLPQLAPYDMISIFGSGFCSSAGTGCSSTQMLPGTPDPALQIFPFQLSPDTLPASGNDTRRQLTVTLYPHNTLANGLPAPLLFATNGQINAIVPGAVLAAPTVYDVVVAFGCPLLASGVGCTPSTVVQSTPFPVNTVATDPGIFTVGSDGQGPAAALAASTYALINTANPAGMRNGAASDTVQIYVTGLGVPPSAAAYGSNSGACVAPLGVGYLAALIGSVTPNPSLSTIDGAVLQDSLFPNDLPPCFSTEPTATVGGVSATISYAAFVGNTVAGLYQVNLTLPSATNVFSPNYPATSNQITNLTAPTQLPVFITAGGQTTQTGVMLNVAPALLMAHTPAYSTGTTYNLSIGHAFTSTITGTNNGASAGITYAVTAGALPKGLALTQSSNVATIAGTPAQGSAGTYNVTVTATNASAIPVTGSISFTYYVPGGLYVTTAGSPQSTFGAINNGIVTVIAVGGTAPYNSFAITTPSTAIAGLSITSGGILKTDGTTPAGTYQLTVTATDSAGLTGTVTFNLVIALSAVPAATANTAVTTGGGIQTVTTITVTGYSGTGGTPLTCTVSDTVHFSCADAAGTVTLSTLTPTAMTATDPYPVMVTVTDTATAPNAVTGGGNYGTQTTVTITVTPGT